MTGFELIQDMLVRIHSDIALESPFTEHVDLTVKLQNMLEEWMHKAETDPQAKLWKQFAHELMTRFMEGVHAVLDARFARHALRSSGIKHVEWLQLCFFGGVLFWGVLQLHSDFASFNTALPLLAACMIGSVLLYLDYLDRFDPFARANDTYLAQLEDFVQQRMLAGFTSISNSHSSQRLGHSIEPVTAVPSSIDHFPTYPHRHTVTSLTSSLEIDQQSVASSNWTTTLEEVKHAM